MKTLKTWKVDRNTGKISRTGKGYYVCFLPFALAVSYLVKREKDLEAVRLANWSIQFKARLYSFRILKAASRLVLIFLIMLFCIIWWVGAVEIARIIFKFLGF